MSEDEGEEESDEDDEEDEAKQARIKEKMRDAKEGKTVFIRNMSYNTDDEGLMEEFEKFGEIDYCKIVMDRETGHSKGCAFLKFKEKDAADKCIKEMEKLQDQQKNLVVDGRSIVVSKAVTKGKMGELERQKAAEKQETDKRNLYLAYEGVITRKTPGAEDLPEAYMKLREKTLAEKKKKLTNAQYFISRTRLCVRNIPLNLSSDELKTELKKFSELKEMKIFDAKIMRSKDRKDGQGAFRSMGYGFLDIDTHENALKLLRAVNNNPDIFGENRRPIVEFSVENTKALKILDLKKQKVEQMKAEKEKNETDGMSEEQKKDFDLEKHREYKSKATDKRQKRKLRYQRRRKEKQRLRTEAETNGQTPEGKTQKVESKPQNSQGNPNEASTKKSKKSKPEGVKAKKQIEDSQPEAKQQKTPEETPRKRKKTKENESAVNTVYTEENSGENATKRSRKSNTLSKQKEESKFNDLVERHKNKLNNVLSGKSEQKKSGDRWFE